ncbi:hypothetical protein AS026_30370 [Rhizobium altiplani]|uniref:Uncharacterized protein n=1 Tax=Rhizobium altiplani TaxID=1864509 RepID=A0A109K0F5_9HYPH|nr:hypothetical protein AS026_30370 [Rhizobium altiplani]
MLLQYSGDGALLGRSDDKHDNRSISEKPCDNPLKPCKARWLHTQLFESIYLGEIVTRLFSLNSLQHDKAPRFEIAVIWNAACEFEYLAQLRTIGARET